MSTKSPAEDDPLAKFEADMKIAVREMEANSRRGAGLALKAALEFVYSHPHLVSQGLSKPFFAILAALNDLDNGRVVPMLEPLPFANHHPESSVVKMAKGQACFYVECLKALGEPSQRACAAVAQSWVAHGLPLEKKRETTADWQVVKGWLDRIRRLPSDDPQKLAVLALREEYQKRPELRSMTKEQLIRGLDNTLRQLRP